MKNRLKFKMFLLTFLITKIALSQLAIIDDKDGFVNVRNAPVAKSAIIYKLQLNEVFYYQVDNYIESKEWIEVYINKNSLSINANNEQGKFVGYVHKSRIKPLSDIEEFIDDSFRFHLKSIPFDASSKIIDNEYGYIQFINGLFVWGTDGFLPRQEVEKISYTIQKDTFSIPQLLYQDLYNPSEQVKIYKSENDYIVSSGNSDGAGYYDIVWVINRKGEIIQRFLGAFY